MQISFQNALALPEQALRLRAERANLLASNLANIDTPNFKAKDINFHAQLQSRMAGQSELRIRSTNAKHLANSASIASIDEKYRIPSQPSIDGNTVEEHVENAEFLQNNLDFQVAFTMLNGRLRGLRSAIRGE